VVRYGGDPVKSGLIASFARPGWKHHRASIDQPRPDRKTLRCINGSHSRS
jgi:hypothetical protein